MSFNRRECTRVKSAAEAIGSLADRSADPTARDVPGCSCSVATPHSFDEDDLILDRPDRDSAVPALVSIALEAFLWSRDAGQPMLHGPVRGAVDHDLGLGMAPLQYLDELSYVHWRLRSIVLASCAVGESLVIRRV
jgi:hypothetical protein